MSQWDFGLQESLHTGPDLIGFCSRKCFQHSLFLIIFQDGFRLVLVNLHSFAKCLRFILSRLERLSSHIVHTDHFGRVKSEVIDPATGWMNPASLEALPNDLKWHIRVHHQVYLMDSVQGFSLCKCPGETTQQPVILGDIFQRLEQQPNHEVVRDELPLVHEGLGQHPDFCVPSHVVSDQIPTGEGLQLEVFGNAQRQGALAGAGAPTITECKSCLDGPMAAKRSPDQGDGWAPGRTPAAPARSAPPPLPGIRGSAPTMRCFRGCDPRLRDGVGEGACERNGWVKTFPPGGCTGGGDGKSERKMKRSVDSEVTLFTGGKGEEGGIQYLKRKLKGLPWRLSS